MPNNILHDLDTGRAFGLPGATATDNLPHIERPPLNTHTIRALDGIADVTRCLPEPGESPEITIGLTSRGVTPDSAAVSFSLPSALAFAYAIIAQVDAASPAAVTAEVARKVIKVVPGAPR